MPRLSSLYSQDILSRNDDSTEISEKYDIIVEEASEIAFTLLAQHEVTVVELYKQKQLLLQQLQQQANEQSVKGKQP